MNNPVLTGAVLIEANGAALNNAGNDEGQRLDNAVVVKQIRVGRNTAYPYISGQAWRRWWREVLYADFDWQPSPVTREAKSAYTEGQPVEFPDDDVFGYMAAKKSAKKGGKGKKDKAEAQPNLLTGDEAATQDIEGEAEAEKAETAEAAGGTQRRTSPLKNSLLISVLPRVITTDFGHFSRGLPVDNANMVPFEHEHYTTCLQGVFTLGLNQVGRFECGPMRDLADGAEPKDGKSSIVQEASSKADPKDQTKPRVLGLSAAQKRERVSQTLKALGQLRHGANLARNLSDVTPAVVLLGFLHGGNAPFQNLFTPAEEDRVALHYERLESVVRDYKDRLLGEKKLYFGYRPGVLANEADVLEKLKNGIEGVEVFIGTPREAIEAAAKVVEGDNSPIQ
jgi:CRISPR-associated protein Cst2